MGDSCDNEWFAIEANQHEKVKELLMENRRMIEQISNNMTTQLTIIHEEIQDLKNNVILCEAAQVAHIELFETQLTNINTNYETLLSNISDITDKIVAQEERDKNLRIRNYFASGMVYPFMPSKTLGDNGGSIINKEK